MHADIIINIIIIININNNIIAMNLSLLGYYRDRFLKTIIQFDKVGFFKFSIHLPGILSTTTRVQENNWYEIGIQHTVKDTLKNQFIKNGTVV